MASAAPIGRPGIDGDGRPPGAPVYLDPGAWEPPQTESIALLAPAWRRAYAEAEACERQLAALQAAADAHCFPEPAEDGFRPSLAPAGEAESKAWWAQAEAIDASLGVPALEEAANRAWARVEAISQQLVAAPPVDVQEAAVKFGVLLTLARERQEWAAEPEHFEAFLDDLMRLAEPAAR